VNWWLVATSRSLSLPRCVAANGAVATCSVMTESVSRRAYMKPKEPLTHETDRPEWVKDQGRRCAAAYRSFLSNNTSNNTLHRMQTKENFELADSDGGGTIDKSEFGALLAASGGLGKEADVNSLFAEMDKDGDGELTEEEIKALKERKSAANRETDELNRKRTQP
jgi:hypothetical protein